MAHTQFTKCVPYNTIRLAQDVALWSSYERTYLEVQPSGSDFTGDWFCLPNMQNVSLGDMQRASSAAVDPDGGRVTTGPLTPRYGIAQNNDKSGGEGVYTSQIPGSTANDFVETRNWNRASNPSNIRLSRFAQWDYTATVDPADMDVMELYNGGSTSWVMTSPYAVELFQDQPIFVAGVKQDNSTRRPLLLRTNDIGDKFSTYATNNFAVGAHASDMNDILCMVSLGDTFGATFGTAQDAYATFGRRTSTTSNLKMQAYTITLNSNGTMSTATLGTSQNATTGASNNYACGGATRAGNVIAVIGGRGNSGVYLNRLTFDTSTDTWSSTSTTLDSSSGYGADRCDVVSAELNYGNTNKYVCAVWAETKSTYNRYVRLQIYNLNTGFTTVGTEGTAFNVTNSIKWPRAVTLATTSNHWYVLVGASDSSGDLRLRVMRYNIGGGTWTSLDDHTYQYNDTSLANRFTLTNLTAVEKTTVTGGASFNPGGTNDFEQRLYFATCCATAVDTDDVEIAYFYYDIDNNAITEIDSGVFGQGRNIGLAKSQYHGAGPGGSNQGQRMYASYVPARNGAGNTWMPIIGGRYIASNDKPLVASAIGLDFKPNWYTTQTGDPGSNVYNTIGTQYTTSTNISDGAGDTNWNVVGRWKVIAPTPSTDAKLPSANGYSYQSATRNEFGIGFGDVGRYTQIITLNDEDADRNNWSGFFDTLITYNETDPVYVRVTTNNGSLAARYTIAANNGSNPNFYHMTNTPTLANHSPFFSIDWLGNSNGHAGNEWAFTFQGESSTYVGVEFSQSPF
jgi:hypothetical protein